MIEGEAVAEWVGERLGGKTFYAPYRAFGIVRDGAIVGGAVFNDFYRDGNVAWTHAGSLMSIRVLADFAFRQLRASRVTCRTQRANDKVRVLLERGGFKYEGTQRQFFGPGKDDDALVFVLFADAAKRWLRP